VTTWTFEARSRLRPAAALPVVDVLLGAALALAAVVDTLDSQSIPRLAAIPAAAAAGAITLRTRAPFATGLVVAAGFLGYGLVPHTSTPMWTFITILVVAFSAGSRLTGRRRWSVAVALVAAAFFVQLVDSHRMPDELGWAEVYLTPLVLVLGPGFAGGLLQQARTQAAELRRLARELEEERQRHGIAAAEAERGRIARELHDVISHSVSVMVVQAGAAEQVLPADSPARTQVRAVREAGKEALLELRRQLGVLGAPTEGAAPLPGLDDLPRLVRARGATLTTEGTVASELAPGVGLAAYRVVQEALTNASRHASGGPVSVRVVHRPDGLEVDVVNGPGAPSGERGSGRGLVGMRERVELYGGRLDAGPSGSDWRVHAWLPLREWSPA
jgi:signal transduction histidine kinase